MPKPPPKFKSLDSKCVGRFTSCVVPSVTQIRSKTFPVRRLGSNRNLTRAEAQQIFARVQMRVVKEFAYSIPYWSRLTQTGLENLETPHRREPAAIAFPEERLLSAPREVALAVTAELLREHAIVMEASGVRLASRLPKLQRHGGICRYVHGCRLRIHSRAAVAAVPISSRIWCRRSSLRLGRN